MVVDGKDVNENVCCSDGTDLNVQSFQWTDPVAE